MRENLHGLLVSDGQKIQVVNPVHFVATKLEAYLGRGNSDPLSSHDIEDILTVVDGRPELAEEVIGSEKLLSDYIVKQLRELLELTDFEYAVQSTANNNSQRELVIRTETVSSPESATISSPRRFRYQ